MLHICVPLFNPINCKYRCDNINKTIQNINLEKSIVYVVELCYGDQTSNFSCNNQNIKHVVFNTNSILWHKENLINLCLKKLLPQDWNYFAWIDGDVLFSDKLWIDKTIKLLQTNDVLQLFSTCYFLNQNEQVEKMQSGCVHSVLNKKGDVGHSGYAWAMSKNCYNKIGGLYENAIIGGGDKWMSIAFLQKPNWSWFDFQSNNLITNFKRYYFNCKNIKFNYLNQQIFHLYHGELENRRYNERHLALKESLFDPEKHLQKNKDEILEYNDSCPNNIKKYIIDYFMSRKSN